jgi:hypothetical protein
MLKVTLIPGRPRRGRRDCKVLLQFQAHFPSGEMAFNRDTSFAGWASKVVRGTRSVAGLLKLPGVNDPYEIERWLPSIRRLFASTHPISGDERNLVPEGIDRPALPLLGDLAVV